MSPARTHVDGVPIYRPDPALVQNWKDKQFVILSYPRSGSHWVRRMMAEISVLRGGFESAAFGENLSRISGFHPPPANAVDIDKWKTPFFTAAHKASLHDPKNIRVYLRRKFEDVLRSTKKSEREMEGSTMNCWWGGTDEEIHERWSQHVAEGCVLADVVIDYEMTRSNPATTVRTIGRIAGLDLTESEIAAAVAAGDRKNMLREQEACENREWDIVNRIDQSNTPPTKKERAVA